MPAYVYRGRSLAGEVREGRLEAATLESAADALQRQGVTPVSIQAVASGEAFDAAAWLKDLFGKRISANELMLFSLQLHTLLRSGVPILRALRGLQDTAQKEESANPALVAVIRDVRESLEQGRDLSSALARQPKVFSPFFLSMVKVGEMTGHLEDTFLRLFHHLEFEKTIRDQVKAALRYPTLVLVTMAAAMAVINVFVIPAFAGVFKGMGAKLPLMTQILIGFSEFTVAWWYIIVLGAAAAWYAFREWRNTVAGAYAWDRWKLGFPLIGKLIHKATLSRFARSFALGLKSGVPVTQSMKVVASTVDNAYIAERIERMREGVERGDSVLHTAIAAQVFTPVVLQMIAVGEESGALDELLEEIAEMYRREVEYELKSLSARIEPVLVACLGVMVLILALGIFLPIWDLGKAAAGR